MAGLVHKPGVAGCDEAGRGPLAGPVVCAAAVLPRGFDTTGLDDSKKLTAAQREELEVRIKKGARWAVTVVSHEEIDEVNILQASLRGMLQALLALPKPPRMALFDGDKLPKNVPCPCKAVVDGDATYACIAAASVLAKTARDRLMRAYHDEYPHYGWLTNFGYPTPEHLSALKEHGPCALHRKTFSPVAEMLAQPTLGF